MVSAMSPATSWAVLLILFGIVLTLIWGSRKP